MREAELSLGGTVWVAQAANRDGVVLGVNSGELEVLVFLMPREARKLQESLMRLLPPEEDKP